MQNKNRCTDTENKPVITTGERKRQIRAVPLPKGTAADQTVGGEQASVLAPRFRPGSVSGGHAGRCEPPRNPASRSQP